MLSVLFRVIFSLPMFGFSVVFVVSGGKPQEAEWLFLIIL